MTAARGGPRAQVHSINLCGQNRNLTSIQTVTGAPVTPYKVRTWVRLNHGFLTMALELQIYNVGITLELRLILCGGQGPISTMKKKFRLRLTLVQVRGSGYST